MEAADLRKHMLATYRALRLGVAWLGLLLPWLLWLRGRSVGEPLQGSMSDYYWIPAVRDPFVGVLFAVAALLVVYRGYSRRENWALNLAALFLAGVALIPTRQHAGDGGGSPLHGACAVLFFACISFVCLRCARDTLPLIDDDRRRTWYSRAYTWLGAGMVGLPLLAAILALSLEATSGVRSVILFIEAGGVYAFSAFWLVKTREIRETDAETLAMEGRLEARPQGKGLFAATPMARVG